MEFWLIANKISLIIFVAFHIARSNETSISWTVLSLLLYFCINITMYILNRTFLKKTLAFFSITISILSFLFIQPYFIFLLPISIMEVVAFFLNRKDILLLLSLIPILYLHDETRALYGLITTLSFLIFIITNKYKAQVIKDERQIDELKKKQQKLARSLNENKEYIKQSEYTFKLEERNRISQEIHDKIGHSMTGALFQMEAAKRLMDVDKEKATELLQNAINISKDGIEHIRMTLKNIKPPTEQVGIHRLKLFIDDFSAKQTINTLFTHDQNIDVITPIQWKVIQENVTEALTNTLKYSDATQVFIDIKILNKMIRIEVKDNGKGADKIKKGLGVLGMEERTASIHGSVIVDSSNGFSVTTLLPIQS